MSEIAVGTEIAGLHIDELAARGGSSAVYQATDTATGARRAVKVLQNPDPSAKQRLVREADLLSRLDHPSLVRFLGLHVIGDTIVLITEWIDGEPLSGYLQDRELSHDEALAILHDVAAPLDYLHANGVVHRDISGSNIMRSPDGSLTLIDLGIGHNVGNATLTNHDLVAGTPRYLAPEIIRGESASARSDQYSLAMLFYELLAGHAAFPNTPEIATALHHHMHTVPAPLDEVDPTTPSGTAAAVARALAKDPNTRFATVGDFVAAAHHPTPSPVSAPLSVTSPTTTSLPERPASRRPRAFAGIAAATIAIVLAVVLLRPTSTTTDGDEVAGVSVTPAEVATTAPTSAPTAAPTAAQPDQVSSVAIDWSEGLAATLECNLLSGSDFATGSVPLDYFGDPPGRERVVEQGGFDNSWALEVGIENDFGQYAEAIPVVPGNAYWFRGWFSSTGEIASAEMGISLLRADYTSADITIKMPLDLDATNFHEVRIDEVPAGSAFALPYLFKDASPGTLLADELVFGEPASCFAEITALGE